MNEDFTVNDVVLIVKSLNSEFEEKTESFRPFEAHTDGENIAVIYFGEKIWNQEDDDGRSDDETLEDFFRRRAREQYETIGNFFNKK